MSQPGRSRDQGRRAGQSRGQAGVGTGGQEILTDRQGQTQEQTGDEQHQEYTAKQTQRSQESNSLPREYTVVRRRTDKEGVREASISSGNPGKLNERERGGQVSRMIE